MRTASLFTLISCLFLLLVGCNRQPTADEPNDLQNGEETQDDPEAVYQQASQLLKQTDQPAAVAFGVALMRVAADSGHTKAQSITGFHLAQGEKKDLAASVAYLSKAAISGDKFAAQNLRRLHDKLLEDLSLEKDNVVSALKQAADSGSVTAAAELGSMYFSGSSNLAQNYELALPLLQAAALGGDMDAANTLGVMYTYGYGVNENKKTAANFYAQAANAGHVKAQASLGLAYAKGHGVDRDPVQAFYWLRLSARQNEPLAQNALIDFIRGMDKGQIHEGHRRVYEYLHARGEDVTVEQLNEEIFNPKMPTLEELMPQAPSTPGASPSTTPVEEN
jgi:TPR repeat protein